MIKNLVVVMLLVLGCMIVYAQEPPPTPEGLVTTPVVGSPLAVRLNWLAPHGPWGFRVYRSVDDTLNFQFIGATQMPSFVNHGLVPGGTYFYAVTSFRGSNNGIIESGRSNIASFTAGMPPLRGAISGTVTDDSTGLPIGHARISFHRLNAPNVTGSHVFTDSAGHYHVMLATGTYLVRAEKGMNSPAMPGYIPEWFDNVRTIAEATPVAVAESSMFVADFGLSRPQPPTFAFVEGTVTDTLGNPIRGATVAIKRTVQSGFPLLNPESDSFEVPGLGHARGVAWAGRTDSLGNYRGRVIAGGNYIAVAAKPGFLPEYYENQTNPLDADIILVNGDTSGINFSLAVNPLLQNSISGVVRDSLGTGVPARVMIIPALNAPPGHGLHARFTYTDSNGVYSMSMVRTGTYRVLAIPFSGYGPAFYKEGAYGVIHWQDADTVHVAGDITGINIGVVPVANGGFARLNGTVRSTTNTVLRGVSVFAISDGGIVGYGLTDASGRFQLDGIAAGPVHLVTDRFGFVSGEREVVVAPTGFLVNDLDIMMAPEAVLSVTPDRGMPETYGLAQNFPNPFNPVTTISFNLPLSSTVSLKVFNLIGQEVAILAAGVLQAGTHEVLWNGKDYAGRIAASGLYVYRLQATPLSGGTSFLETRKMVLLK